MEYEPGFVDVGGDLDRGQYVGGGGVGGVDGAVGAKETAVAGGIRAGGGRVYKSGLLSWFAGPYGDLPINYDGTYSADEIDHLADEWNRALYLQLCLAQAGAALRGPAGAPDLAEVGVR